MPAQVNKKIRIGISKDTEKAKNMVRTKSKYLCMSVITAIPKGAALVKKPNNVEMTLLRKLIFMDQWMVHLNLLKEMLLLVF